MIKMKFFCRISEGTFRPRKNVDFGIGSSFRAMLFYCREVFRRRSPAAALRAAAAVQQLAASQQQPAAFNSL